MMSTDNSSGTGEIMLFGVSISVDPVRKSVSLNDLSDYHPPLPHSSSPAGYASADDAVSHHVSGGIRQRKRGVPWTEEEHKLFLLGLQRVGKGSWRGISKNYVKTRTPTQVASHAQKYFLRQSNFNRRRRTSLFDITTESVTPIPMEKKTHHERKAQSPLPPAQLPQSETSIVSGSQVIEKLTFGHVGHINRHDAAEEVHAVPHTPVHTQTKTVDLNLSQRSAEDASPLSLDLSLSFDRDRNQLSGQSADKMISVA